MVENQLRDRPVFICGHPKSGTSLVRNLLDSHPQLVVFPEETAFFRRYLLESKGLDHEEQLELAERRLLHIFEWNLDAPPEHQAGFPDRDYSSISSEQVAAAFRHRVQPDQVRVPGDLLSAAVLAFGEVSGQLSATSRRWVEKTPYNERYTGRLFKWWPGAKCIHIVRDPRDNYASYSRKEDWTPEFFSDNWMRSTRAGLRNRDKYGVDRYWLLRFEDLTEKPDQTLAEMRSYLGIEDAPSLRIPTRMGIPWGGNSMFEDSFEAINQAPVNRWKTELDTTQSSVIEGLAARLMKKLGYQTYGKQTLQIRRRVIKERWRAARWDFKSLLTTIFTQEESG